MVTPDFPLEGGDTLRYGDIGRYRNLSLLLARGIVYLMQTKKD